jgi:hypothetical protein
MGKFIEYAWGIRPEEELYALNKDPHQAMNLATDPAYSMILRELRNRLMAELKAKADPRLADDAFDRPPFHVMDAKR